MGMTRTAAEMNKGITSALEKLCLLYVVEIMHVANYTSATAVVIYMYGPHSLVRCNN